MKRLLFFLLFAALLVPIASRSDNSFSSEAEFGYGRDVLYSGYPDWNNTYLDYSHRFGKRHSFYGELRETKRFNLRDREISGGYYSPLSQTWTLLVEASASPEHNVLPKDSWSGQLQKSFDGGWDVQAGLRRSRYDSASVDLVKLTGERYWGNFRASYAFYLSTLDNAGSASSHNVQLSYYFPERSYVTLGATKGREVDSLGSGLGTLTTDISSASLSGRYWLNDDWGLSYEAIVETLGKLYTRKGIRLGLRYAY